MQQAPDIIDNLILTGLLLAFVVFVLVANAVWDWIKTRI